LKKLVEYERLIKLKIVSLFFEDLFFEKYMFIASVPKIILLYGDNVDNVELIHRLMNVELDHKKFGLVIIRVCIQMKYQFFKMNFLSRSTEIVIDYYR
jgi:hypothetical protein